MPDLGDEAIAQRGHPGRSPDVVEGAARGLGQAQAQHGRLRTPALTALLPAALKRGFRGTRVQRAPMPSGPCILWAVIATQSRPERGEAHRHLRETLHRVDDDPGARGEPPHDGDQGREIGDRPDLVLRQHETDDSRVRMQRAGEGVFGHATGGGHGHDVDRHALRGEREGGRAGRRVFDRGDRHAARADGGANREGRG
jgi:hypothetical protein